MRAMKDYHSLRFKIKVGMLLSLVAALAVSSCLRYISFRHLLVESLERSGASMEEVIEAQLAAYVRSRLILLAGSIIVILLVCDLMLSRMIVSRLKQFLSVVKRVGPGNLGARVAIGGRDEITELAAAFNRMTEELQRQAEKLSTLNTLAVTVGGSLDLNEVLRTALDEVLELTRLEAGWVTLWDDQGEEFRLAASRGLPEGAAAAHAQCNWKRCVCASIFELGQSQVCRDGQRYRCRAGEYLQKQGLVFHACVPLKSRDVVLGVMSLAGPASSDAWMVTEDSLDMLTAIGRQIGIAVENASLYEELRQKEMLRRQLLERGLTLQEEERKRIARELHDQIGQRLTSIILTLGVLEETLSSPEAQAHAQDLRDTAAQILKEVRDLALHLRPSVLDDLGLLAALRHHLKGYQARSRLLVDFQVLGLDGRRLSPEVETALFRITQEALTNVVRHAQAHGVTVLLEHRGSSVMLIVEDDGRGFDVTRVMDTRPHEGNLGLYGMRERASLLGGTMTIESTPGRGTAVFVRIPLEGGQGDGGQDPPARGG
jgi:signal transduction histidine kinase